MTNITHLSVDEGAHEKYFHTLPNMYDDDLDPYEYRLIGHYKRVGTCYQGTRTIAETTKMSVGKVSQARKALQAKGLIKVEMLTRAQLKKRGLVADEKPDDKNEICVVTVVDVMAKNIARYSTPVHVVNTPHSQGEHPPVHQVNIRRTRREEVVQPPQNHPNLAIRNALLLNALLQAFMEVFPEDSKPSITNWKTETLQRHVDALTELKATVSEVTAVTKQEVDKGRLDYSFAFLSGDIVKARKAQPTILNTDAYKDYVPPPIPVITDEERERALKVQAESRAERAKESAA